MKVDDAIETIARYFNDLIGSIVPGLILAVGLTIMHFGPQRIGDVSKSLESAAVAIVILGLMFASGHALIGIFEVLIQPGLRLSRIVKRFDEASAKQRQSYVLFVEILSKLQSGNETETRGVWSYNDLRSVALSISVEGASLGRRFMFISMLCNGVGAALLLMAADFIFCMIFDQKLLYSYVEAPNWIAQSILIFFVAIVLFKRGEIFYERAMATPFSIAVAELKFKRERNVSE